MDIFLNRLKKDDFLVKYDTEINKTWSDIQYLNHIVSLKCSNKKLTYIPDLPNCKKLYCDYNLLTNLPNLPRCKKIYCNNNLIENIPVLPNCKILICNNNRMQNIPSPLIPSCTTLKFKEGILFREKAWEKEKPGFTYLRKRFEIKTPQKIQLNKLKEYFLEYASRAKTPSPIDWLCLIASEYTFYQKSSFPYLNLELALATIIFCDKLISDNPIYISTLHNITCNHAVVIIEHEIMEMYFRNEKLSLLSNVKNFLDLK